MGKHGKGRRPRTVRADALTPEQRAALSPNVTVLDAVATLAPGVSLPASPADPVSLTVRVDLDATEPPVWRRLTLPGSLDLGTLHGVLQSAMGWTNDHLHQFGVAGPRSGEPLLFLTPYDVQQGRAGLAETAVRLDQVLRKPGDTLSYLYDFGDGWEHTLRLEAVRPLEEPTGAETDGPAEAGSAAYGVRCVGGERACPPEDIGGPYVYNDVARWVRHGHDPHDLAESGWEPADLLDWLGEWDPDAFDLDAANRALAWVRATG